MFSDSEDQIIAGQQLYSTFFFLNCNQCEKKPKTSKVLCLNCLKIFSHKATEGCCSEKCMENLKNKIRDK